MTNPQLVRDFLKSNRQRSFCDDCLEEQTGVDRHQVHTITSALGLFPQEFRRTLTASMHRNHGKQKMATLAY